MFITLLIFFVMGLSTLDAVANTFYLRDHITLSASQLVEIGIWTSLPWSIKLVFGSIIDNFPIMGNNRKSYIALGAVLMALGDLLFLAYLQGLLPWDQYTILLVSGLTNTLGIVLAQSVANTLSVEEIENKAKGQVYIRMAMSLGLLLGAILTGFLAKHYSLTEIYAFKLILPGIILLGLLKPFKTPDVTVITKDWRALGVAIGFGLFCVITRSQMAIFAAQMIVINYLLWKIGKNNKPFMLGCLAIFLFRIMPSSGPGYTWWLTGPLGFDQEFMGHLRIVARVADIVVLGALSGLMAKGNIFKTLLVLTIVSTLVNLPDFIVYYQLLPVDPRHIFLVDTAVSGPLADLSMIPLGILIANNSPKENRATYMALTASFMNMALVGGDLITKYLNDIYVVTRTDFSQLGELMLWTFGVSTGLSVIGLILLWKGERK